MKSSKSIFNYSILSGYLLIIVALNVFFSIKVRAEEHSIPKNIVQDMIKHYKHYFGSVDDDKIIKHLNSIQYDINGDGHIDWLVYFDRLECGSSGCTALVYIYSKKRKGYCFAGYSYPEIKKERRVVPDLECKKGPDP